MNHVIRAEGLVKRFGETTALNGVDLAVRTGTVLGLLGPNGADRHLGCRCPRGGRPDPDLRARLLVGVGVRRRVGRRSGEGPALRHDHVVPAHVRQQRPGADQHDARLAPGVRQHQPGDAALRRNPWTHGRWTRRGTGSRVAAVGGRDPRRLRATVVADAQTPGVSDPGIVRRCCGIIRSSIWY